MLPDQKLVNGHISVEPLPPLWLLYCKSAERVHRPGSRRLGGVEATGASPGVAPSRPHRSGPRAGPVRRTPCARGAWGGERAGGWASDLPASLKHRRGPVLCSILWRSERADIFATNIRSMLNLLPFASASCACLLRAPKRRPPVEVRDVRELRDFAYRLVHPGGRYFCAGLGRVRGL